MKVSVVMGRLVTIMMQLILRIVGSVRQTSMTITVTVLLAVLTIANIPVSTTSPTVVVAASTNTLAAVQPLQARLQRSSSSACTTPDIMAKPYATPLPYSATTLPASYSGEVARFCSNKGESYKDFTASVVWEISFDQPEELGSVTLKRGAYYADDPLLAGQNKPNEMIQADLNATVVPLPGKGPGQFIVLSHFRFESFGYVHIGVIIKRKAQTGTGKHHSKPRSGAFTAVIGVENTIHIYADPKFKPSYALTANDTPHNDPATWAGIALNGKDYPPVRREACWGEYANVGGQCVHVLDKLFVRAWDPFWMAAFYNEYGTIFTDQTPYAPLSPMDIGIVDRGVISALTSGDASPTFCTNVLMALVNEPNADKSTQQELSVLADMIAANASAVDVLLDNVSTSTLQTGQLTGDSITEISHRLAAVYFANHLDS